TNLLVAFARTGTQPRWTEHCIGDAEAPSYTQGYGSPTILVEGRDVAGSMPAGELSCRLYVDAGEVAHAPSVEQIATALAMSARGPSPVRSRWRVSLGALPGIGVSLLPKVACPACWPAYAGVLSS